MKKIVTNPVSANRGTLYWCGGATITDIEILGTIAIRADASLAFTPHVSSLYIRHSS